MVSGVILQPDGSRKIHLKPIKNVSTYSPRCVVCGMLFFPNPFDVRYPICPRCAAKIARKALPDYVQQRLQAKEHFRKKREKVWELYRKTMRK